MKTPDEEVRNAAAKAGVEVDPSTTGNPTGEDTPSTGREDKKKADGRDQQGRFTTGRKRGRPKKSETPTPDSILPGDQWETVTGGMLDMLCEAWQIKPRGKEQKKALAQTSLVVIEKHLGPQKYAEEIALAVVALSVFGPMMLEKNAIKQFRENQAQITEAARQGNPEAIQILEQMGAPLPEVVASDGQT